jgi:chromosome segregation ATPase
MARTLGEIEALARSQNKLSDEADKASEKLLNLRGVLAGLDETHKDYQKTVDDVKKATKDERIAKDKAKAVQLEYNSIVGDSAQKFKQLNEDIDEFIAAVTLNKSALDKLGIGAQNIADQFTINAQMQGANLQKINQINKEIEVAQSANTKASIDIVIAKKKRISIH